MKNRRLSEIFPSLVIVGFGAFVAFYASANYPIGSLQRMGPGMFPMALGVLLAGLGLMQAIVSCVNADSEGNQPVAVQWRAAFFILSSVIVFSLLIRSAGFIPAVLGVVGVSALADKKNRPLPVLVLSATLCAIAFAIFRLGLGMHFKIIGWPF